MKHVVQQFTLLLILALLTAVNLRGNDILVLLSGKHAVFEAIAAGAKKSSTNVKVLNTSEAQDIRGQLSRLQAGCGIVAIGTTAWDMAKEHGRRLPKVYCSYGNAVHEGVENQSFIIDASTPLSEYSQLFTRSLPKANKIAVIHKQRVATKWSLSGFRVKSYHINSWNRLKSVTNDAFEWADIVWLPTDPEFTSTALAFIIKKGLRKRKPVFASSPRIIRGGALAGLTREPEAIGEYAVRWLEKSPDGRAEASYPPSKLVVNSKVAKFLGVSLNK